MKYLVFLLFCFLFYLFLIAPRLTKRAQLKKFYKQDFAHRGYHCAKEHIPENSLSSFQLATKLGYGIELDVHLTKDKQLVVFHDNDLSRMCGVSKSIEDSTFLELQDLVLLSTSERIPLLSQVFDLVNGRVPLLIELKIPHHSMEICKVILPFLENYSGDILIQSFHSLALLWFRIHAPHILRGQLSSKLNSKKETSPWIFRFLVRHLLTNVIGRPDFVSYKWLHLPSFSVRVLRYIFQTPIAVWTLRTKKSWDRGKRDYEMQIFEPEPSSFFSPENLKN